MPPGRGPGKAIVAPLPPPGQTVYPGFRYRPLRWDEPHIAV